MLQTRKTVLQNIIKELKKNINFHATVKFMLNKDLFTKHDKEKVFSGEDTSGISKRFVAVLKEKPFAAYEHFYEFLVHKYPDVAKKMEEQELSCASSSLLKDVMMPMKIRRLNRNSTLPIQEHAIKECLESNKKLSIVLVGKTGSGKSSTGNSILGKEDTFTTSRHIFKSCTQTNQLGKSFVGSMLLRVMDTPGLFDTSGKVMDNKSVLLEIAKAVIDFPEGIDVFIIVCRIDSPFTEEERKSIENIEERFGKEIFRHSVLVFTRGSQMTSATLSNHLKPEKLPLSLKSLVEKVSRRVFVVENKLKTQIDREVQREWMVKTLCSFITNKKGPPKYTNDQFNAIQELIRQNQKNAEDVTSTKNITSKFVHELIKKTDEATLQNIIQKKEFDQTERALLVERVEEANLFNDYIDNNLNSIIEKVISENNVVIKQKLSSLIAEKKTKEEFERQRHQLLLEKVLDELKQKKILKVNEFLHDRLNHHISNTSGEDLISLLNATHIPNEIVSDINHKVRCMGISSIDINEMARSALESKREIINMKIQSQVRQEEKVSSELCELLTSLNLRELNFVKQNKNLNEEQQVSLRQKLKESKFEIESHVLKDLTHTIITEVIDKFITMKEIQIQGEKQQRRTENLLKMENKITNYLFDSIEKANEEELKSFHDASYPNENDVMKLMSIVKVEEILENDIKGCVTTFLTRHERAIQERHDQKRSARVELEKRINEQKQHQEKKNRAREEVLHIADNDVRDFLRSLRKREIRKLKTQLEKNELPTKLFEVIKKKLSDENMLDDEELRQIITAVLIEKKEMLMKAMSGCFPGISVVTTKRAGKIPITSVRVGDKVLTLNGESSLVFEEVFFMAHSDKNTYVSYLKIETAGKQTLLVSPNHCLPVGHFKFMKAAKKLKVNDVIFTTENNNIIPDVVTSVGYEFHHGAYCPYTLNGTIVVDNVLASCFTSTVAPKVAQAVLTPLRFMYRYTPLKIYTSLFSSRNMSLISVNAHRGAMHCKQKTKHLLKRRTESTL